MQDRHFTDEELVAFLDGEDDFAPVTQISHAQRTDKVLAKRLEALSIDRDALSNSFKDLRPYQEPYRDIPGISAPHTSGRSQKTAMIACVALLAGLGAGFWLNSGKQSGWAEYVAAYQALYTTATLTHVSQDKDSQQTELDRVAGAIGKTISVEMLQMFGDADYKRAQILGFQGRALVQLAFATKTGVPLALCIIRSEQAKAGDVQSVQMEGLSSARWSTDGYEYLLIGGTDSALVSRIASGFASMQL